MKPYTGVIKTTLITFLVGGLLILWGYKNDGIVRIILGALVFVVFTKDAINTFKNIEELRLWKISNNGKLVFFYPAKKGIQAMIEKKVLPLLPDATLKVYYNGPALVGDIKRSVIIQIMNQYKEIKIKQPAIFKFVGNSIYIETLPELNDINSNAVDVDVVKAKIDKIACV